MKSKKITLFPAFLLIISLAFGQQMHLDWITKGGGAEWDMVTDMTIVNDADIFITGTFTDRIFFGSDSLLAVGDRDVFVAHYTIDGTYLNSFSIGTRGFDYSFKIIADDDKQSIILALKTNFTLKIGSTRIDSLDNSNFMLLNLTPQGALINYAAFATSGKSEFTDLCLAPDGDLYFTGYFEGKLTTPIKKYLAEGQDLYLGKVSKNGKFKWLNQWGAEGVDQSFCLAKSKNSKLYLSGMTHSGCFGSKYPLPERIDRNNYLFLAEINEGGQLMDVNYPFYGSLFKCNSITLTDNTIWMSVMFKYKVTTTSEIIQSRGSYDMLLMHSEQNKLNFSYHQIGGNGSDIPIQMRKSGNQLALAGMYSDTLRFNDLELIPEFGGKDIFVATINNEQKFGQVFALGSAGYNYSSVLAVSGSGIYVAGEFNQQFGTGEKKIKSSGKEDVFLTRFENCDAGNPLEISIDSVLYGKDKYSYILNAGEGFTSYLWNDNSTDQFLTTKKNGLYYVEVQNALGCFYVDSASISSLKSLLLSMDSETVGEVKFYPTLTHDKVNIYANSDLTSNGFIIEVLDLNGKVHDLEKINRAFRANEIFQIDLSGYSPAPYVIRLITDERVVYSSKVIVR
ncbi:MAG: hypothetical protein ACERKD_17135 [Prolixibacteraceae bacterium]